MHFNSFFFLNKVKNCSQASLQSCNFYEIRISPCVGVIPQAECSLIQKGEKQLLLSSPKVIGIWVILQNNKGDSIDLKKVLWKLPPPIC